MQYVTSKRACTTGYAQQHKGSKPTAVYSYALWSWHGVCDKNKKTTAKPPQSHTKLTYPACISYGTLLWHEATNYTTRLCCATDGSTKHVSARHVSPKKWRKKDVTMVVIERVFVLYLVQKGRKEPTKRVMYIYATHKMTHLCWV
jgi:hypothetical protein